MHLSRKANTDTNWFPKIRNNTILICICIPTHLTILYISQTTPFLIRHQYSLCKAGNRVYEDGVLSRLLFDGGYVSFRDSVTHIPLLHQGLLRQQPRSDRRPRKRGGGEPLRPRDGKMECNGCLGGEILRMVATRVVWRRPSKRH